MSSLSDLLERYSDNSDMNAEHIDIANNMLKRHEGFMDKPYLCSSGVWTIGYGFTFITEEEAAWLLDIRVKAIADSLEEYKWYRNLSEVRKAVVIDMVFNLGAYGFCGFKNTIKALKRGDYYKASEEMLDSKWADQVGDRATELATMMRYNTR